MASRGHLGGLAAATPQAIRVLDAAGFELIIIETVGVGQAEVAIASLADSVAVLLAPAWATPSRRPSRASWRSPTCLSLTRLTSPTPQQVVRTLRGMLALGTTEPGGWKPPIITTTATTGEGLAGDGHPAWTRTVTG